MRAHAPASVTGLFVPAEEPGGASRGASVALAAGVTVDVRPAAETVVTVDGEPAAFDPVERLLDSLEITARVAVEPEVPLGHGFGASGAATLATALAANATAGSGLAREELLEAAHRAELAAGTGQGDVFVQDRGGFVWSGPDGPRRREPDVTVEYATAGSMATEALLGDERFLATARRVGPKHLGALGTDPSVREFAERSRAYVAETDLATAFAKRRFEAVEAAGGAAGLALFGDTVFAVDVEGVLPNRTAVSPVGARLIDE